jgi:phosphoribosylanthranilate isomerase
MSVVRIKICGITNPADGRLAAELGADALGLNFWSGSPRGIDFATAQAILRELPPFIEPVGVFVNKTLREVSGSLRALGRSLTVQWHGDHPETGADFSVPRIVAFSVQDGQSLVPITRYLELCRREGSLPAAILVDAPLPGQYGGTGQRAPWELLADFRPGVPLILAGGLTTENVGEAIRIVRPYAVDVASGVESSPGRKDAEKMRRFIATVREKGVL